MRWAWESVTHRLSIFMGDLNPRATRQVAATIQFPIDEFAGAESEGLIPQLRAIADEIRGYTERIEAALKGEQFRWTDADLADMFECSELTIVRERRAGKIKYKRVAGKAFYTRQHIEEYLASSK